MASTSSSTSHPNFRFDVFLSFRGEDTRHNFTDHLYRALIEAGFRTFRDNEAIERGQELKPEIDTAIIKSRASVIVLSEKYANSTWCLDELCLILEQRRKLNHFVLPVFYQVDPSDVRNQRGSFAIKTFNQLTDFSKKRTKWTEDNVRRWKAALTEVANLTGLELSRSISESSFIADVVKTIKRKLDLKQVSTPADLIGTEAQVEFTKSWSKIEKSNVIEISCGGNTTVTQHIYNLKDVEEDDAGVVEEVLEVVKEVLDDVEEVFDDVEEVVKEVFDDVEEVLEVVDDVEDVLKDVYLKFQLWLM